MIRQFTLGLLIFSGLLVPDFGAVAQKKEITVHCAGEMRQVMHHADLSANASLDTLLQRPNIIALGPLEGLQGEITVINSVPYITRAKGRTAETTTDSSAKAAFLVYSQVPEWEEYPIPSFVKNIALLEDFIVQKAREQRYKFKEPVPFMVTGPIKSALVHVVNYTGEEPHTHESHDKIKVYFQPTDTEVEIAGFYSTKHKGVFTHHDSFTHMHLVTADRLLSGHVDKLQIVPGKTKLLLPKWPQSQRRREFKLNPGKKPYKEPVY